jgi:hypothetical protein
MVEPGLLEKIISPAILRAKTSLMLGETDTEEPRAFTHKMIYKTVTDSTTKKEITNQHRENAVPGGILTTKRICRETQEGVFAFQYN